ncbi:hypothetical protein BASA81_011856 [Batrachochytrium salamandrivorans]|nr:hypothetical protein BASA81_011856 [Batrachochytrium salamandrivorans]
MCLIGAVSVSSYPIGGSESESESCRSKLGRWVDGLCDLSSGKAKVPKGDSSKSEESAQGSSKLSAIKERVEVPPEDSYKPKGTIKKPFQWSGPKGKGGPPKGDPSKPTKTTKSSSKLSNVSDDDGPKPLQDPQTQKQNNGVITIPKKGPNRGSSGPAGEIEISDLAKQSDRYWEERNRRFPPGKTESGGLKRLFRSSNVYDNKGPKPLRVPPIQKQNNREITTPKVGFNPDLSGPAGLDMAISTGSHQTKESKGSALGQTKGAAPKGGLLKPTETTKSSSTWYVDSDNDKPKPPQSPPTQKQSNGVIKTPKKESNSGSSSSTGPTSLDMNIDTDGHQTKESKSSTLGQTKGADPKEDTLKPTKTTKSSSKLTSVSDNDKPKPPQSPPTQKQSNGVIKTPKKESNSGSSVSTGPTSLDMNIDTDGHQTKESKSSALGQTKGAAPKEDTLKPKETNRRLLRSSNVDENDKPKPSQDPPTQKQSGGAINTPKVGSKHGSSGPTGAAVGPNGAIDTGSHQAKESKDSTLGQTKGADSSIPDSLTLESTNPDLPGQLIDPQEKKRPIPTPTPSKKIPEVTTVHEFLALDNLRMPSRNRQEIAFKLFTRLNKPKLQGDNLYILTRISEPEKERIEQENMVEYFELSHRVKKKNQKLLTCEREILSFPGSGPSLASKYSEAKKSQTKTIKKRALTDEEEGEYLIHRCLITRGKLLSAQSQSKQAWSKLTDEQIRFYDYIKPLIKNLTFKFEKPITDSE